MSVRKALVLELGGIPTVFYGAVGTYTPAQPLPANLPQRTAINCIRLETFTPITERLPEIGGVGKASGVDLTLVDRNGAVGALFAPTLEGIGGVALAATVPAEEGTLTLTCAQSITGFDAGPGLAYVGQETFVYDSFEDATFTLNATYGRRSFDSVIYSHLVDNIPARSFAPLVTPAPVAWNRRKAVLRVHEIDPAGAVASTGVELIRGYLTREPYERSGEWVVSITSELAKFDRKIGTSSLSTTLVDGAVWLDGENASYVTVEDYLPANDLRTLGDRLGTVQTAYDNDSEVIGDSGFAEKLELQCFNDDWEGNTFDLHRQLFGVDRGNFTADPQVARFKLGPPEPLLLRDHEFTLTGYFDIVGAVSNIKGGILSAPLPSDIVASGNQLRNLAVRKRHRVPLGSGFKRWPIDLVDTLNQYTRVDGLNGSLWFTDVRLTPDATDIAVKRNVRDTLVRFRVDRDTSRETLWYPWLFTVDENGERLYGLDLESHNANVSIRLGEPPTAFYQPGMRYILIRDNVLAGAVPAAPQWLRVVSGEDEYFLEYDQVASVEVDGATVGYRVRLTDATVASQVLKPFGNWRGEEKVTIEPFAWFDRLDPREILRRIMLSGFGGIEYPSSDHSVLPNNFGLAIEPEAIDFEGIRTFPVPSQLREISFAQLKPAPAREVVDGLLKAMGAALVMANVNGTRKITLVKTRAVNALQATTVIANSDWVIQGYPDTRKLDNVVCAWEIATNYNPAEDKFLVSSTLTDADATDYMGNEVARTESIKIRGIWTTDVPDNPALLDGYSLRVSIYKALRGMYGVAIREVSGRIQQRKAQALAVGHIVTVSVEHGRNIDGTKGIVNVPMRVTEIGTDPISNTVPIRLIYTGVNLSGYAPVADVTAVIDVNTVELSEHEYSGTLLGFSDLRTDGDYLCATVPVTVECVHVGAEESNETKTLTAYDSATRRATIAAHGLSVGDRVRPTSYDASTTDLRRYVHFAYAGVIGSDDVPGFRYS